MDALRVVTQILKLLIAPITVIFSCFIGIYASFYKNSSSEEKKFIVFSISIAAAVLVIYVLYVTKLANQII